jgi:hypothetical protein
MRDYYVGWLERDQKVKIDSYFRELVKEKIRRDPVYFIENWVWTYDPRKKIKIIPFILYPFQKDFIRKLEANYQAKKPLLVEKSRDMGFSWLVLSFITWKALTERGFSAGIGSRKAQLVDELGNMKSLMERVRFILRHLPHKLRSGYNQKRHSKNYLIQIPETEAHISGEAGDEIGRGDRTSLYLLDEFAFIPRSSIVQAAVSQTSDFLIYGSTPNGKGNEFSRLRWKTEIDVFTMDWKQHPDKNEEWYEKQKQLLDEVTIAQEIDRSYSKSKAGRVFQWFDAEKHGSKEIRYNPNQPVILTFDWGIGDPTACLFMQYYDGTIHIFDWYERKDTEISKIFTEIHERCLNHGFTFNNICGWYGDPDGRNRNLVTGDSVANFIFTRYKVKLRFKLPNLIKNRIMSVRMMGEHGRILVSSKCGHVIECFENYRFPDTESGEHEKPVHDWTSHTMSALEYYCVYEHGMDQYEQNNRVITSTSFR